METIQEIQEAVHELSTVKGWWDDGERNFGEMIALVHSELSEALEEWRKPNASIYYCGHSGKPEGIGIELADALIRILDLAQSMNINMSQCISIKHEFNKTRPRRHGGKRC